MLRWYQKPRSITVRFDSRVGSRFRCLVKCVRAARLAGSLPPVCQGRTLRGISLSIRLMNAVVETAPVRGGEYLLLLCMARYAADDGSKVFPSVATLAKDSRQHERAVQKQLRSLEAKGLIKQVGVSRHNTVNYRIVINMGAPKPPVAVVGVNRDGPIFKVGGPRTPESSSNTSLNRQVEENPHVKTAEGSAMSKQVLAMLKGKPLFKGMT